MEANNNEFYILFLLSIPIACVAWTVTHEDIFKEPRQYCAARCKRGKTLLERKFFIYLPANIVLVTTYRHFLSFLLITNF